MKVLKVSYVAGAISSALLFGLRGGSVWAADQQTSLSVPVEASANQAGDSVDMNDTALEVIVVTAQKRVESVNDVPIAVSAFDGDRLKAGGIDNLQDLSVSVPGLYVAESFVGDSMFIRGIGSGQNNLGFEQAVGQVIDGYFYGRSRFSRLSFLDVERVEVLKGPQGALLGKNTTAGAINITTASVYDELEGDFTLTYESEAYDGYTIEGAVGGGLTDSLRGRLAWRYDDKNGFLNNTSTGADEPSVDDLLARVTLVWDASEDVEATFQYQYGQLEHLGGNNQYSHCDTTTDQSPAPGFQNFTGLFVSLKGDDCQANYSRSGSARKNGVNVEGKETNIETVALTVNWDLGEHTLTSLTGYAQYDYVDLQDGDRTDVEAALPEFSEDYNQFTQELRLTSPIGESFDYIAGLYYMEKEQYTDYLVHFSAFNATRGIYTIEDGRTYAVFGQATAHINNQWDLTLGGRYTDEEKQATNSQFPTELYEAAPSPCQIPAAGVCLRHDINDKFDESNFSPVVNVQYRPNDDAMFYGSVRKGFKAGGFDHLLVAAEQDPNIMERFQFDSEQVISYEAGAKLTLLEDSAQLNAALYRSEFDDLQLGGFLNSTDFTNTVTNAASAITQGLEMDFRWRPTRQLTLSATLAYLDSTYDDYVDAPCYTLQTTGCETGRQDLSGEKLQFASDWKWSVAADYYWSLSDNYELHGSMQVYYADEFPLQADLDPKLVENGYTKVDARLTLRPLNGDWEVSLITRNLTDELSTSYGDDVPGQAGSVWRSIDAPRSIALQSSYRF